MPRHRPARLAALAGASAALLLMTAVGVPTAHADTVIAKPIVFPVDGPVTYTDTFGAPRVGHRHEGQDLMGTKMLPLLATVTGTVSRLTFNNSTGNSVVIMGPDGWTYHYIHVNNDTPGTDDGRATRDQAFPPDIVEGARVTQGQVVGFMGDSGNAEARAPHLHFEIRRPTTPGTYTGVPVNAYPSLQQAAIWSTATPWSLRGTATAGPAQEELRYGTSGDRGLLCDWDGDGQDEAVVYRAGTWHLRDDATGFAARQIVFGTASDTPLCADVDGDGADEPVLFRSGGTWTIRTDFEPDALAWTVRYGLQFGDQPVLGDWDGNGRADLAIYRAGRWHIRSTGRPKGVTVATFFYGMQKGDQPVAGDWDGDGRDDPGIYRGTQWHLRSGAEVDGFTSSTFDFGDPGSQPVVGHRGDQVKPGIGVFQPKI
jgi:hypothetical protein